MRMTLSQCTHVAFHAAQPVRDSSVSCLLVAPGLQALLRPSAASEIAAKCSVAVQYPSCTSPTFHSDLPASRSRRWKSPRLTQLDLPSVRLTEF